MKRIDFENGTVTRNIFGAALPMLVAQILNLLYNIVDRIYIARIPDVGTAALGAVGLCFPLIVVITAFANLFGSGGAPLFSIYRGKKKNKEAEQIMDTAFSMVCVSGLILMAIGLLFARPLLVAFRGFQGGSGLCLSVSDDLSHRHTALDDRRRHESFHQRPGLFYGRNALRGHWSRGKSPAGSAVYLCAGLWRPGCSHRDSALPVPFRRVCPVFPYEKVRTESSFSSKK